MLPKRPSLNLSTAELDLDDELLYGVEIAKLTSAAK